jgi:pyruvate formate lyase activating enzyme
MKFSGLKESILYEKLSGQRVCCSICQRRCNISAGEDGFCKTRLNREGKLYSKIYGKVSSCHKAPIEIKPVYHYLPGSYAMSFGSVGCNFLCPGKFERL